ncbi:MAG: 3-deoxy-D-manno-octulosonate 8-phosphate phosphatase (KDO 8-P phosphatase) [Gammaproteobacteria bacterium]|jgi:3-deoxy-D-manno-octulosonate 8-phosphate phosphatase (KDO 8-P phosphatase)
MPNLQQKSFKIKLLILDVDGILTDGGLFFDNQGNELKRFNALDGHGIKMLIEHSIEVAIITGRSSEIVKNRARELGITHLYQGYTDKISAFQELMKEIPLNPDEIAYMGDDLPDLEVMLKIGLSITVPNADDQVKQYADWLTSRHGGQGAVREVCNYLLSVQGKIPQVRNGDRN